MSAGLEVDRRNDLPTPYYKHDDYYKYYNGGEQHSQLSHNPYVSDSHSQGRRLCGLRPTTFFLSIALALFIVLAAVAAGVAGSLAAKRGDTKYIASTTHSTAYKRLTASRAEPPTISMIPPSNRPPIAPPLAPPTTPPTLVPASKSNAVSTYPATTSTASWSTTSPTASKLAPPSPNTLG